MTTNQLRLVQNPPSWKIDEETKDIGRRGLAAARAALKAHTEEARNDLAA